MPVESGAGENEAAGAEDAEGAKTGGSSDGEGGLAVVASGSVQAASARQSAEQDASLPAIEERQSEGPTGGA
jgi:hypothetical protein